jgi:hypothetical protein
MMGGYIDITGVEFHQAVNIPKKFAGAHTFQRWQHLERESRF